MKLIKKSIEKDGSGYLTLCPEEAEDMWHIYNLVAKDDELKASTIRRVVSESATGTTEKTTVRLTLTITVESVEFDTQACMLRINGRNISENKHVKMGAYHTIDLELNRNFTLGKPCWDIIHLDRIRTACDVVQRADIAAVMLQEGLANICLVTQNMTIVRQRIELGIPRKRKGVTTAHDKFMEKFFEQIYQAVLKHVNFEVVKVLVIASPGFLKDQLYSYIIAEAQRAGSSSSSSSSASANATSTLGVPPGNLTTPRGILENKSKIILVNCSSGHKHVLQELLNNPSLSKSLLHTKFSEESRDMNRFYKLLSEHPEKAFYGYRFVAKAVERGAVEVLMVTDELFRSLDIPTRKKYIELVETVRGAGGKTHIFSSLHVSGEQLASLTGVACICMFPCDGLDEEVEAEIQKEKLEG